MTNANYRKIFIGLIVLSLIVRIYVLWLNVWPINGDEAQYWSWGKHLAWGYYSKPPMVAWVIALTSHFFNNGPIGLRIGTPIAYAITSIFIYLSGKVLFREQVGFWSAIMFLFIPGVTFSSSIISTDPFLLLFWSIAFYCLIRALEQNALGWWLLCAVMLGFAFYSKYAAILFTLSLFLYLLISNQNRKYLKAAGSFLVLIVPFIMLIPNWFWNYNNHFASIVAVKENADLTGNLFHFSNLLNFLVSQFAVFGPILFTALLIFLIRIRKYVIQEKYLLLIIFTFLTLGIMTIESFLSRAHANWSAPAYVTAAILVVAFILEHSKKLWLWLALILHFLLVLGFANIQTIIHLTHAPMDREMTITSWPNAALQIKQLQKKYPEAKILVNRRMLLTQIMYFGHIPLKNIISWNPNHLVRSQYDLVTNMKSETGKNFLLFSYDPNPKSIFLYFKNYYQEPTIYLNTIDGNILPLYVYYLTSFKGY